MATISTLAVNLIARTSAFEKGMRRGRNATKSLKTSIQGTIGTVARFAKRLALVAGVGAMGFFVKTTLASLDAVSKLSRRIGIATEELLGLRHAAELAGVSAQSMDKALEIFVRRMGEVKSGSGEAKRGLEALGLSAEQMIAVTPEKALLIIADRIQELGSQAEKSAAAYFLFGRSGAQLLNLFEQGADGIAKAQKEAEELGLTLQGLDLTQVEAANDAMTKFKSSIKAAFTEVIVRLTPAIEKLANFMTKHRDAIISSVKSTAIFIAKAFLMVKAIKIVVGAIKIMITVYKALAAKQIMFLSLSGPAGWAALAAGIGIGTAAIIAMNKVMDKTLEKIKNIETESKPRGPVAADLPKSIYDTEQEIISLHTRIKGIQGIFSKIGVNIADRSIAFVILQKRLDNLKKHLLLLKEQRDVQQDLLLAELKQAKAAEKKQKAFEVFMAKVRQEGANIVQFMNKAIDKAAEIPAKLSPGRFQQIRSEFIDVAALNPARTQTNELMKLNNKTDITNELLREQNRNAMGVFQT